MLPERLCAIDSNRVPQAPHGREELGDARLLRRDRSTFLRHCGRPDGILRRIEFFANSPGRSRLFAHDQRKARWAALERNFHCGPEWSISLRNGLPTKTDPLADNRTARRAGRCIIISWIAQFKLRMGALVLAAALSTGR